MKNGIEAMITDITATTAEAEDYTGEDGLLYCGKCHTPKEAYFSKETAQWLGHDRHPTAVSYTHLQTDCSGSLLEILECFLIFTVCQAILLELHFAPTE